MRQKASALLQRCCGGEGAAGVGRFILARRVSARKAFALLILGLGGSGLLEGSTTPPAAPLKDWPDGPIRYILSKNEAKVFKELGSEEERALFIERFWARRDPTPQTLANEYHQLFWERVREANDSFADSGKPGWMSDRGKIHILHGAPTKIEDDPGMATNSGPTAGRGLIRWIYEGRPDARLDLDPVVVVPFVRQATGEYRLSYDPELASVFFDPVFGEDELNQKANRFLEQLGAPRATELSVMLDLGRLQEIPTQAQVLIERVETLESYEAYPLSVLVSRYVDPDDGRTIAVVTVDIDRVPAPVAPAVVARFRPTETGRNPRMLGEDAFHLAATADRRVAQGRLRLDPGTYDVMVLVADPATAATGISRLVLEVPEPRPQLGLSDVVWAAELAPLEYQALASHDEPFILGPFRVVPRVSSEFVVGESPSLFYEISGGTAPFAVSYAIEGLELDGRWIQLGAESRATQDAPAQGWQLATGPRWPAGDYRVRIAVESAGQRVLSYAPFRLVPAPPTVPGGAAPGG